MQHANSVYFAYKTVLVLRHYFVNLQYRHSKHRVRQKYLTILQNSCEWNHWRGEVVLEHSSSETQNISVVMERWSVEHRAFAVETYLTLR